MKPFEPKQFQIPELKGISAKTIEEHLKLYAGYVKNLNVIMTQSHELAMADMEKNSYVLAELHRKISFEYNGMKNHEFYFEQLQGGSLALASDSLLVKKITQDFGPFEQVMQGFKMLAATTRGIGWAIMYYDRERDALVSTWVDEQHIGHLNSAQFIFGIDMWEHSYVADYLPSGKKQYVEDYFANVNWNVVEKRFFDAMK